MSIKTIKDPTFNVYKKVEASTREWKVKGDLKQKDKLDEVSKGRTRYYF